MRAHRLKRGGNGVRRMGVVDKHRRPVVAGRRQLHPPTYCCQMGQRIKHICRIGPAGDHQPTGQQHVFRLKPADQLQPFLIVLAPPGEPQILPRGIKPLARQPQIPAVAPHGDHRTAPRLCNRGHFNTFGVVNIDHRCAFFWQHPRKQPGLGVKIGLECLVIIQMVLREIGKSRRLKGHTVKTALVQPVA